MASYVIAGKADDPSFARALHTAKQIEAACPNVFFVYEMKHPDCWKEFINDVFRKYDFHGYPEDFPGPLVWTQEGDLIGGGVEFVQKICVEKFGISAPPGVSDPMFENIAADNLKQVKLQQQREQHGPPLAERCETTRTRAAAANILRFRQFIERRRVVVGGFSMESWISGAAVDEESSDFTKPMRVDARLTVGPVGPEQSHLAILHPEPLVDKHLVLVQRRHAQDVGASDDSVGGLDIDPSPFRADAEEDLSHEDFAAAMEVLTSVGGLATWMGLRVANEYRKPLDTHLQVLPFPVHSGGEDWPLRYPLELVAERAAQDNDTTLKVFPFRNTFSAITTEGASRTSAELATAALAAYEAARGKPGPQDSIALAFTTNWMVLVPLLPPEPGSARHETWLQIPPPPPCALCGVVVCKSIAKTFPETAGLSTTNKLVSNRAEEEGISEGTEEYDTALREVRISAKILDQPIEIIGVWALPRT